MTASQLQPAVFLDRDGVLNQVVMRNDVVASPRTFAEFVLAPGVVQALAALKLAGFRLCVVTNQPDVRRGLMDPVELDRMHEYLMLTLPIDRIADCRHDDRDGCMCRKPRPGMLLATAEALPIDLSRSFMVGDQDRDTQCGAAAGCTTVLLARPYNSGQGADIVVADIQQAASAIIARMQSTLLAS